MLIDIAEVLIFVSLVSKLDVEFGKMTDGKADLFIRRWEASIIPKLKAVITMEGGVVASLMEGIEDKTDVDIYVWCISQYFWNEWRYNILFLTL